MKTIIKAVFLTATLALVVAGCQKESDDLNVSLKSTIAFTGGIYWEAWTSGNAEAECALAGGCDGGSYKIDSGVDAGVFFDEGGVTVTGINKQEFSWTSESPVCKIIVKAGRGAYVFDIGGAQSGTVPYPTDLDVKAKDISHITFCFSAPLVLAFKGQMIDGYARTVGDVDFYIDFIPNYEDNKIYWLGDVNTEVGNIIVKDSDGDGLWEVMVDNSSMPDVLFLYDAHLFVGTVEQFNAISSSYYYPYQLTFTTASSLKFDLLF